MVQKFYVFVVEIIGKLSMATCLSHVYMLDQ